MTPDELTAIELLAQTVTDRPILHRYVLALCREVRRLTAELAAARADTARLDWLQSRGASPSPSEDDGVEYWHYGVSSDCAASLREIIDTLRVASAAGERER